MGTSTQNRVWSKIRIPEDRSLCWEWTGPVSAKGGHGKVKRDDGSQTTAHRFIYELQRGPVAHGMVLSHKCDNPVCCNPDHLRVTTQKENVADMIAKGRGGLQAAARARRAAPKDDDRGAGADFYRLPTNFKYGAGRIVSVVGPPGAGKSLLIEKFTAGTQYKVLSIDSFRRKFPDNEVAWKALMCEALGHSGPLIIESSGLAKAIRRIESLCEAISRPFKTVLVTADAGVLADRVASRPRSRIGDISFTIEDMIRDCATKLPSMYPDCATVDTTNSLSVEAFAEAVGVG